jgi:hypothetical protein
MDMFPNAGALSGMPGAPPAAEPQDDGKLVDLGAKIDKSDCYARNESPGFPMSNLFIGDSRLGCKSDTDEQLIIHIGFSEFVKVREAAMRVIRETKL